MNDLIKLKIQSVFSIVIGSTILVVFALNYLFLSDQLFYLTFSDQLATERIAAMVETSRRWQWLGYLFIPVIVLIRVSFTATCLYTGYFMSNVKIGFGQLFRVALLADFVFVLSAFAKLVILIFFKEVDTITDLQFQPLSLLELVGANSVDTMLVAPLTALNLFELLYWLALARLLTEVTTQSFSKSLGMVASSYGIGLLMWILFTIYLTVNLGQG